MKQIILLLDGTWNDADQGPADTNVVRLREIISKHLEGKAAKSHVQSITPASSANQQSISSWTNKSAAAGEPTQHLVYYERGVGTGGFLDLFFGGAFGVGLGQNVRRAYRFLSLNYAEGDEVFLFGFSRGSYTARSLAGYIAAVGLLRRDACTDANESLAWSYYRKNPPDRVAAVGSSLRFASYPDFAISCVGVFDTVGALGIPVPAFWRENRDLFEFHDVGLSGSNTLYLHALAIDEHRLSFEPTLWRRPKFGGATAKAEQVWFAGAHSDVGGGNVDETRRAGHPALDDITLDWMVKRVREKFRHFPVGLPGTGALPVVSSSNAAAAQDEPRRRFYRALPFGWRSINNTPVKAGVHERVVARDRHAETIGESIHLSAVERLGKRVRVGGSQQVYAPKNLVAVLAELDRTDLPRSLKVIDYDGAPLPDAAVKRHVAEARRRLLEAAALSCGAKG